MLNLMPGHVICFVNDVAQTSNIALCVNNNGTLLSTNCTGRSASMPLLYVAEDGQCYLEEIPNNNTHFINGGQVTACAPGTVFKLSSCICVAMPIRKSFIGIQTSLFFCSRFTFGCLTLRGNMFTSHDYEHINRCIKHPHRDTMQ